MRYWMLISSFSIKILWERNMCLGESEHKHKKRRGRIVKKNRAWLRGDLTSKVRVSIRSAKKHVARCFHNSNNNSRTTPASDARFGAAALQPFSVLRPFYERRVAFRTSDPREYEYLHRRRLGVKGEWKEEKRAQRRGFSLVTEFRWFIGNRYHAYTREKSLFFQKRVGELRV